MKEETCVKPNNNVMKNSISYLDELLRGRQIFWFYFTILYLYKALLIIILLLHT